ncbi:MAG: type pilin protein [Burkholderiaceae bacterium]|nr:type pilin protein [Burkholderiaceae bacterium]
MRAGKHPVRIVNINKGTGENVKTFCQRGFSLIELMIVVAVVAILAAVVYPSYQESVRKTKRAEGKTALMRDMQQQERDFSRTNSYTAFTDTSPGNYKGFSGDSGASSAAYKIKAEACSTTKTISTCVLLTATPNFTDAKCGNLTLTSEGTKGASGTGGTDFCWK